MITLHEARQRAHILGMAMDVIHPMGNSPRRYRLYPASASLAERNVTAFVADDLETLITFGPFRVRNAASKYNRRY